MTLFAGRYELGPVIGRGGMAEVRAATDTRLDRPVAIKVMRPEAAIQPMVRDRFEAEALLAARLSHPNVVSIFDSGEHDGVPFIVMERLPGETLHDRLSAGPMTEDDTRAMALEILAALETAHAAGILHRDIKPANILEAGGHWKVADFGIAKARQTVGGDHTATGLVLGTPAYLAPERLYGTPASVPADIYAVGIVAYEALTGHRPFRPDSRGFWPGSVALEPLVPLRQARPGVDPVLARTIERSLDQDPRRRFQSAGEMAAALGAWPPSAAAAAPTATRVLYSDATATVLAPAPTSVLGATSWMDAAAAASSPRRSHPTEWGPRERRRAGWAALALAALMAAAIGLTTIGGHGGRGGPIAKRTPSTAAATSTTSSTSTSTTSTTVPAPAPHHAKPPKGPVHGGAPAPGPGPGPGPGQQGDGG